MNKIKTHLIPKAKKFKEPCPNIVKLMHSIKTAQNAYSGLFPAIMINIFDPQKTLETCKIFEWLKYN